MYTGPVWASFRALSLAALTIVFILLQKRLVERYTGAGHRPANPFLFASLDSMSRRLAGTFGAASLSAARPMGSTTPIYLAPLTETFPELPECYAAATLRQCRYHRSGVTDIYDLAVLADLGRAPAASNGAAIELLSKLARSRRRSAAST